MNSNKLILSKNKSDFKVKLLNKNISKISKKQELKQENYYEILKLSYVYNKSLNKFNNLKKKFNIGYNNSDNDIKLNNNLNNKIDKEKNILVPIIIKNDNIVDYNTNNEINIYKDKLNNFIKKNLDSSVFRSKPIVNDNNLIVDEIIIKRRKRRGTFKNLKELQNNFKILKDNNLKIS